MEWVIGWSLPNWFVGREDRHRAGKPQGKEHGPNTNSEMLPTYCRAIHTSFSVCVCLFVCVSV